ncbi:MAG: EAL domain-containing protein [Actinomycetota bacterium]|nr:EAL domain-containing protein [Actinomycetota bacterium]
MATVTRRAVTWWIAVAGGGLAVTVAAVATAAEANAAPATFWVLGVLVVLSELRPIRPSTGYHRPGVPVSAAFIFATMDLYGPWPAVAVGAVGVLAAGVARRGAVRRVAFDVGRLGLGVVAAGLFMWWLGPPASFTSATTTLAGVDLVWIVPGWFAFFAVNTVLVTECLDDLGYAFATTFGVLVLSPVVVLVGQQPVYLPLLLLPLLVVHRTAERARDKEHQSLHDSLTGLPNRTYFHHKLVAAIEDARRAEGRVGLCLLDLDRFKEVNDTLGHHIGDQLLSLVAQRLHGALRPDDVVARIGGDEFAILLAPVRDDASAMEVAGRLRHSLTAPFHLGDMLFELEASIGVALYPEHGTEPAPVMRRADVAMYLAKEERTGVELYCADRDRNSAGRLALLGGLRVALETEQLEVHYQPKVSLGAGGVIGVEALVRWRHPTLGLVMPDDFVPLAEHSGLMVNLTAYVVDRSLAQVASWREAGLTIPVAVNVSMRDLHGPELTGVVGNALERYALPASSLLLELTERVLTRDSPAVTETLGGLRRLGVTISLDDFGTGYSSMALLKQLPVTEIKIDRSFVSRLTHDDDDATIVGSIVDLAHGLGMRAVAEGVETREVWDLLDDLGCDAAQGWYVSHPMTGTSVSEWMLRHPSQRRTLRAMRGLAANG